MPQTNILDKIIAHKRRELATRRQSVPKETLIELARDMPPPKSLVKAIRGKERLAVIAEIKKASPSAGMLREHFDPVAIAKSYVNAGADAISVLTDERFFQGSLEHIRQIRPLVDVPILRKDFIIDDYQLLEARAAGADAVLLIVAALKQDLLAALLEKTDQIGMAALVEVHTEDELEKALGVGAPIIGINNRSLETFEIDLGTTERLASKISLDKILIGESGIATADDLVRMRQAKVDAVLVGGHFMRQPDPGAALAAFKKMCR